MALHCRLRAAFAGLALLVFAGVSSPADTPAAAVASFAEPAISPDHAEIAFVRGGDIWTVPASGGDAQLLVTNGGGAARPIFSPDGKRLAYVDTRAGETGVYVTVIDGGAQTRLTHDDVTPELDGWSGDGRFVYFTTSAHNIAYDGDIMRVAVSGGTPIRVVGERFVNAMQAAPAPDGRSIAYVRNGFVQWWRRGHSHMDTDTIVSVQPAEHRFTSLTDGNSKDRWPMWSPAGTMLYFVSDRSGNDELWSRGTTGSFRRLTTLAGEPILWPTISGDGRTIAFEHDLQIWTYDTSSGAVHGVPITLRGGAGSTAVEHVTQTNRFVGLDLAPDGKKIAFVARGRVFAAASDDTDVPAQLVTVNPDAAYDLPVWAKDSRRLAYVVDRGKQTAIGIATLPDGAQRIITPPDHFDDYPHWSPDASRLAFVRDGRELHVLDVATQADRIVARGWLDRRPFGDEGDIAFSPSGDWIAYVDVEHGFSNARVVSTGGGESRPVSFLPNANAGPLVWSTDGTRLFLVTSQRTENGAVAQIDLIPRAPQFREDTFRRLFDTGPTKPESPSRTLPAPAATASAPASGTSPAPRPTGPTRIEFTGIRERLSLLATGLDVSRIAPTPDGKLLLLVAAAAGQQNVYAFSIDDAASDPAVARQLTSTPGVKTSVVAAPDGKTFYYLDAGTLWNAPLDGSKPRRLGLTATYDVDFAHEKSLVFAQAWSLLDRWYADPHFHGADWNAVERKYEPHALGAQNADELRRVISLMLGELNSSHLAIRGARPPGVPRLTTGRLGAQWSVGGAAREGVRIAEVAPLGPLALAGVKPGEAIVAVDGRPLNQDLDIDELLSGQIGKRTELRIAPAGAAAATRTVVVLPVDTDTEGDLWYRDWVNGRRRYVERISGGRVGYVHIADMEPESLQRFYTDLDVQNRSKAAVIVDIRNNRGGFVDPYALDVLTRHEYARFQSRFGSDATERTSLGQRALDKPTALVINEHSLSDAENFTEGYRTLHAGPVVGEPTAGWIIFTDAAVLADNSTLRLPTTLVFGHDGIDMELHPRPVDIRVENTPGAAAAGDDPQLQAAVRELLRR